MEVNKEGGREWNSIRPSPDFIHYCRCFLRFFFCTSRHKRQTSKFFLVVKVRYLSRFPPAPCAGDSTVWEESGIEPDCCQFDLAVRRSVQLTKSYPFLTLKDGTGFLSLKGQFPLNNI
jgi:hypothetical protein